MKRSNLSLTRYTTRRSQNGRFYYSSSTQFWLFIANPTLVYNYALNASLGIAGRWVMLLTHLKIPLHGEGRRITTALSWLLSCFVLVAMSFGNTVVAGPVSDVVLVRGPSGASNPIASGFITEDMEASGQCCIRLVVPGVAIDLDEAGGTPDNPIFSDRLIINGYTILLTSETSERATLLPRQGAIPIRVTEAQGSVTLSPWTIIFSSDNERSTPSDVIDVVDHNGDVFVGGAFPNRLTEGDEGQQGLISNISLPPRHYDIYEGQTVSDYVDIDSISGTFCSAAETGNATCPAIPAGYMERFIEETSTGGGAGFYTIEIMSDANVPEPATGLLLTTGLLGLFGYGWRQRRKAVQV